MLNTNIFSSLGHHAFDMVTNFEIFNKENVLVSEHSIPLESEMGGGGRYLASAQTLLPSVPSNVRQLATRRGMENNNTISTINLRFRHFSTLLDYFIAIAHVNI